MSDHVQKRSVWIIVMAVFALLISIASAGFSALVYLNTPQQIRTYAQAHKNQLKGDRGDMGPTGLPSLQSAPVESTGGSTSSYTPPVHCDTHNNVLGSSTDCY